MNWILAFTCFAATLALSYGTLCRKAEDCGPGRCCVAPSAAALRLVPGLCLKLAKPGKICSEPESQLDYFGGKYVLYCPCEEGYTCQSNIDRESATDLTRYFKGLRCQKETTTEAPEVTTQEVITEEETTEGEVIDEVTTQEETIDEETTPTIIVEETTTLENIVDEENTEEVVEEQTEAEVVEEETEAEVVEEETEAEVVEEETEAEVVEEETEAEVVEEETEAEGVEEETKAEVVDEESEEINEELPEEIAEGPGGEHPRDDDCENWEYPC